MTEFIIACKNGYQYEPVGEIVRCKDCAYWQYDRELPDCSYCSMNDMVFSADDFCSRGKRKEVEE